MPRRMVIRHSCFEHLYPIAASRCLYTCHGHGYAGTIVSSPIPEHVFWEGRSLLMSRGIFMLVSASISLSRRAMSNPDLDFKKIAGMMNDYFEHLDSCKTCTTSKLCGYCYNHFAQKGHFDYASEVCKNEVIRKKTAFSRAFTIGERYPHLLDALVNDHYTWLSKVSPTLGD